MNDWGIPDWRDERAYGEWKLWGFFRWRWEFYRRRDDLRAYFAARTKTAYQQKLAMFEALPQSFPNGRVLRPDEAGFSVPVAPEDIPTIGYSPLPNPRISAQPLLAIFPAETERSVKPIHSGWLSNTFSDALEGASVKLTDRQSWILGSTLSAVPARMQDGECALIFDLDKPLSVQLEAAKEYLRICQTERHGKPLQTRKHPTKRLEYLRTLDAREAGASWREIAIALLPMRKDEADEQAPARETKARDIWEAANALRFNF